MFDEQAYKDISLEDWSMESTKKPPSENPYQRNDRLMQETKDELRKWQELRDKVKGKGPKKYGN